MAQSEEQSHWRLVMVRMALGEVIDSENTSSWGEEEEEKERLGAGEMRGADAPPRTAERRPDLTIAAAIRIMFHSLFPLTSRRQNDHELHSQESEDLWIAFMKEVSGKYFPLRTFVKSKSG
ncbi:coproporphyrinogen-III oxidase [Striga asiatica]|uniref:Coproporphyrinogen-III oxidase n=1 Tax=Striga asiatica TaxID=4170 RepID=A0A5A7P6T5_STRAF|nr:coproporphyrinogen-III oxidase [Striga asiatica]